MRFLSFKIEKSFSYFNLTSTYKKFYFQEARTSLEKLEMFFNHLLIFTGISSSKPYCALIVEKVVASRAEGENPPR